MKQRNKHNYLILGALMLGLAGVSTPAGAKDDWKVADALDQYDRGVAVDVGEDNSLDILLPEEMDELFEDTGIPADGPSEPSPATTKPPELDTYVPERRPVQQLTSYGGFDTLTENMILDVLELKDMDIKDVLKLISEKSGLNIIAGTTVQGKVTIYLKNVKLKDALRIILDSNRLAYKMEDGIVRIMPAKEFEDRYGYTFGGQMQTRVAHLLYANPTEISTMLNQVKSSSGKIVLDPKSGTMVLMDTPEVLDVMEHLIKEVDVSVETRIFELTHTPVKELSEKIAESLSKDVGKMKVDERTNKIIVTDTPLKLHEISRIVSAFDVKETQVLIEARIMQIVLSDEFKFGVDWEAIVADYHNVDLTSGFDILTSTEKRGSLSVGTIDNDNYTVLVEALQTVGITNILSNPSISTMNNQEAKILVGSTEPYVTTTTTTPASGPTTTAESVNFIDVGVKLFVTPTIHRDRFITMKIKPEVSSVTRSLTTSNNNTIPIVETSEAETTVMVKDSVTIVIGGLIKEEKIQTRTKVPLLGDIPFIGAAFRSEDDFVRKTEIVIFLTPKIMTGDVDNRDSFNVMSKSSGVL